jgi:hypothetical protein
LKKRKQEVLRYTCSQRSQTQNLIAKPDILLWENKIERKNWTLVHDEAKEVARDVWDLGKDFGLMHRGGEEGEILQELALGAKFCLFFGQNI